jgi:TM2 domain-containing membrane protein YozV
MRRKNKMGMTTIMAKQGMSAEQLAMVGAEVDRKAKSKGIAYVIWFFLGGIGGHRYYNGNIGMGVAMTFTLGGLGLWSFLDVFFIGRAVENRNAQMEMDAIQQVKALA